MASTPGTALRLVVALWACEATLARVSSDRQPLDDLGVGAAGLVLCLLPLLLVARWWPAGRLRRPLLAALAAVAPAMVVTGVLSPVLHLGGPTRAALLVAGVTWLGLALVGSRLRDGVPEPGLPVAVLALAVAGAWLAGGGLPPVAVVLGVAACFVGAWALTLRLPLVPVAVGGALLVATWPVPPPTVAWAPDRGPAPDAPDLVLMTIDTLRADDGAGMALHQQLAARGVAFHDVQTAAPWTLPSFGTVHTGLPVSEHGAGTTVTGGHGGVVAEVATLAERLAAAGYDTAAVVGRNPWLGPDHGFAAGFDVYDYAGDLSLFALPRGPSTGSTARPFFTRVLMKAGLGGRRELRSADELVDRAIEVVRQRRDRPLFLWIHFMDCHLPFRHATDFPLPRRAMVDLDGGDWSVQRIDGLPEEPLWPTAEGTALMREAYRLEIAVIDQELPRLLAEVEQGAPQRRRVLTLVSDHGEEFFDHGHQGHGHAFYQEVTTVPLVIAGLPGVAPGTVRTERVHHLDLAPTLLAAAGLPHDDLPGFDLAGPVPDRPLLTENVILDRYGLGGFAVRSGQWKAHFPGDGPPRLYDLDADPGEQRDLAAEQPAHLETLRGSAPSPAALGGDGQAHDPAAEDMLRTLGYIE